MAIVIFAFTYLFIAGSRLPFLMLDRPGGTLLGASNLFSNVPFVMLARHWVPAMQSPVMGWHVLALASTLAGNLTLVGSVANLIVFETARGRAELSFWGYLKVGVPVTATSLVLGLVALLVEHAAFG